MKNTRKVVPCGKLFSQGRGYFLLHPEPIVKDSWQGDNCYRFVVVPDIATNNNFEENLAIYPPSRHIVTNAFLIDYMSGMPEITILVQESLEAYNVGDLSDYTSAGQLTFEDLYDVWKT